MQNNICVVLHNICIKYNVSEPEDTDEVEGLEIHVEGAIYQNNEGDDMEHS